MPGHERMNDKMLATTYFRIQDYYQELLKRHKVNTGEQQAYLYGMLHQFIVNDLFSKTGTLKDLDPQEHFKAFNIMSTCFEASLTESLYKETTSYSKTKEAQKAGKTKVVYINYKESIHLHNPFNYSFYQSIRWDLVFSYLTSHTHHHSSRGGSSRSKEEAEKARIMLKFIVVGLCTTSLGILSSWYLLGQLLDSMERLIYSEGSLKATLTLLSIVGSAIASTMLAAATTAEPLAALAIAAGIANPAGIVAFGVISLGMTLAAVTTYLTNKTLLKHIQKTHPDALDPRDPKRFALTDAEYAHLLKNNLDPIKVKCAITALRKEMGPDPIAAPLTPNFLFFRSRTETQGKYLQIIRDLREGNVPSSLQVGNLTFKLGLDDEMRQFYQEESRAQKQEAQAPTIHSNADVPYAPPCCTVSP